MTDPTAQSRPAPAAVHPLGRAFLLVGWTGPAQSAAGRLQVTIDGAKIKPPFSRISLATTGGHPRTMLAVRCTLPPEDVVLEVSEGDGGVVACAQAQAPARAQACDAHALLTGLDAGEQARFLRFLLEVCSPLFRLSSDPTFIANVRELLTEMAVGTGQLAARCTLTPETLFCEGVIPETIGERLSAVLVSPEAIARVASAPALLPAAQPQSGRAGLGLVLPNAARQRATTVVVFGENGLVCRSLGAIRRRLPGAHAWISRFGEQKPQHRRYVLDTLARPHGGGAGAGPLLRELRARAVDAGRADPARPGALRVTADLIVGCRTGVFISGQLVDPHRLVAGIEVERLGIVRSTECEQLARFRSGTAAEAAGSADRSGFALFASETEDTAAEAPVRLSLGLRSGARIDVAEGPSLLAPEQACDAVFASLPADGADARLLACVEPAVRALLDESLASPGVIEVTDLGSLAGTPRVSVLIPFAAEPELLRLRMAVMAGDPEMARAELVHLVDRPEDRPVAERLLADLQSVYGLASRLVLFDRRPTAGSLLNAGLRASRGGFVAVLGRTTVPESGGWLGRLIGFLKSRPQRGIAGAQTLHPDQALVSVGSEIGSDSEGRWNLRPQLAGFPRDYAPAAVAGRVDALSPDCFLLSRALLNAVHGFGEDYLLESSVVADLCLKARARGLDVWRLPEPAVFRFGSARSTPDSAAAVRARHELDRRLLERRWCDVVPARNRCSGGGEPQALCLPHEAADAATQEAA